MKFCTPTLFFKFHHCRSQIYAVVSGQEIHSHEQFQQHPTANHIHVLSLQYLCLKKLYANAMQHTHITEAYIYTDYS